ncbi:MAG: L-aspartate oxidase [Planctomycetes bacterium]|nr:L-aspartate oxidase [Planctomycetota bacterium]
MLHVPNPGSRYLVAFDLRKLRVTETDVLIIGSGLAALRAAIEAARSCRVLIATKGALTESNSRYSQGGIAAALDEQDTLGSHIADTLNVGCGLCDEEAVRTVITEGADCVRELIAWGARFDRVGGKLLFAREGGHSRARVLHRGDQTGAELVETLARLCKQERHISIEEGVYGIDLLTRGGACIGALVHDGKKARAILASTTLLATGGAGQVYRETTNPSVATGDGIAMAYRAGAELVDMEFMQFHPTTLYLAGASRSLISEAVRGASGVLRDRHGRAFMKDYHPMGDLAPRDVVSRAMLRQMLATNDTQVYLDVTHIGKGEIKRQFPNLYEVCGRFGLDVSKDLIPVRPAAHYMVGGVRIDLNGRTSLPRLFAAGECAAAGFHGANRLASNSLLECLVVGRRAGRIAAVEEPLDGARELSFHGRFPAEGIDVEDLRNSLRSLMWRQVGIERDREMLEDAIERVTFWSSYVLRHGFTGPAGWELQNLLTLGLVMAKAALKREESRGVHYRSDFSKRDDARWQKRIIVHS